LIDAGVARVVAAMEDPNPDVRGKGFERLRAAGVEVEMASEYAAAAAQINEAFIHAMRTGRPLVTLKAALTLDGKIGARGGDTGWITSEEARAHAQMLRHSSDAILTGIGTVLADDPLLTDRTGMERSRPLLRMVLDSKFRIPGTSRMVESARDDLVIFTTREADAVRRAELERRGVRVVDGGLEAVIEYLAREKYRSLLIEAGAGVNGSALDGGLVDKIFFYYAPKILGGLDSLPVAGGAGRSRSDAVQLERLTLHNIAAGEFAVEAYVHRDH
jgi:diaminohydroxyphosphoribosylaminopyrimidine deaminase/5-amino-6-(5-phosphoribosylamino)uracil reductase